MRISDWSSDVCSSALGLGIDVAIGAEAHIAAGAIGAGKIGAGRNADVSIGLDQADRSVAAIGSDRGRTGRSDRRSEESRGGRECVSKCRPWVAAAHTKKNNNTSQTFSDS